MYETADDDYSLYEIWHPYDWTCMPYNELAQKYFCSIFLKQIEFKK